MVQLRPYQEKIIEDVRAELRAGRRRILIQLATGGGKTNIAGFIARGITERRKRLWFLCPRDFLLDQTSATFRNIGIPHGFIAAGRPYNPYQPIQICGVGTVTRRLDQLTPPDYFIWDETKHIAAASWDRIFKWAPNAIHFGLDATPWRLDGRGLGDYYETMVCGPSVSWLIGHGFLSGYRAFAPTAPSLAGVHTVAGDYNRGELGVVMDQGQIIGDMVRHYREKADGKRAVYFGVSVEHSKHIAATFNANGIAACHLDGSSTTNERRRVCRAFAIGELGIISNVDILGEGFDVAAQSGVDAQIECVGLARPTKSLSLHLQQIGRALRPKPDGSPAVILDHASNLLTHGLPDDDREWSLKGAEKRRGASGGGPPVRQCPSCYAVQRASVARCGYCGHQHVVEGRKVEEIAGELAEVDSEGLQRHRDFVVRKIEERECRTTADWERLGRARGHAPGWAYHMFRVRNRKRA